MIMTKQKLENIKKYANFLQTKADVYCFEHSDDEWDEFGIEFFGNQLSQIHNVLIEVLKEYSVDCEFFLEDIYFTEIHNVLINLVEECLNGNLGCHKIYVHNETNHNSIINVLNKIKEEIPIKIYDESNYGMIYVQGRRQYLDIIYQHISKHPIFRNFDKSFVPYCYPDSTKNVCEEWKEDPTYSAWCINPCNNKILEIDTKDYVTVDEYIKKCFNE